MGITVLKTGNKRLRGYLKNHQGRHQGEMNMERIQALGRGPVENEITAAFPPGQIRNTPAG